MKRLTRIAVAASMFFLHAPAAADRLDDAEAARQNGQYQRAIELFDEAIAKDRLSKDDLIFAHYNIGQLELRVNRPRSAVWHFSRVIKNDPRAADAFDSRGQAHMKLGNIDMAIADFSQAIRIRPNYSLAFYDRGGAHERKGLKSKALSDYEKALSLRRDFTKAKTARDRLSNEVSKDRKTGEQEAQAKQQEQLRRQAAQRAGHISRMRQAAREMLRDKQARRDRALQPGHVFKDCSACPEIVVIPSGSFRMGDLSGSGDSDAKPVHDVRIDYSFAVGKYEVTRGEYATFANATGHEEGVQRWCGYYTGSKWEKGSDKSWRDPGFGQTERDPATCVNWDDAKAYVSWLSRRTGKSYRLLSETEWEYAARAGSSSKYNFGNSDSNLCDHGNGGDRSTSFIGKNEGCDDGYGERTAPVGRFKSNGFGIYDVHGNVGEWTGDCWHDDYAGAPSDGSVWVSGGNCSTKVVRGGSWSSRPRYLRSAARFKTRSDYRTAFIGFRVARTLSR